MLPNSPIHSLLLVRNGVDHDARVLRAARVAQRALGGSALVVGVATASAPAGEASVEGVSVLRLPARPPHLERLTGMFGQSANAIHTPGGKAAGERETSRMPDSTAGRDPKSEASHSAHPDPQPSPGTQRLTPTGRARRALSGLSFTLQALSVARRAKPRLVQANDWNTMWAGLIVKLLCGSRLVYDSHELWADRNGRWELRPWLLACEALFVHAADEVVTSSPGYADVLAARYRVPRPLVVRNIPECGSHTVPAAPDRVGLNPAAPGSMPRAQRSEIGSPPSPPSVVYVGGLMPGRGLEQMIEALPFLPGIRLRAVGPGTPRYRTSLLARAEAAGVEDRVELHAPVAPGEVQSVLAGAAAGLCLIQPICRSYELCLPNKLFEYAAAGVPVLASNVPVIAAVVLHEGLGEVVPTSGPRALAASLERLLAPDGWRLAAERAKGFAAAHDWPGEASTLAGVYIRAESGIT